MRASESDIIPVVSVGYGRPIGVKFLPPLFEGTPYRAVSFLDLVSSREPFRYSAHNMGVVLETLHPRPKAFVVGIAIDPSYCEEMGKVWNSYVENVLKPESENGQWENNAFVPLPRTHFVDPKQVTRPPADILAGKQRCFDSLTVSLGPKRSTKGTTKWFRRIENKWRFLVPWRMMSPHLSLTLRTKWESYRGGKCWNYKSRTIRQSTHY